MAIKYEDMVNDQKRLSSEVRRYQEQQARAAFNQSNRSLQAQLAQQRQSMAQSRSQIAEQSYLAQRATQQGAQSRGLGSSGLRDLSSLQSQLAQGRAVNEMEQVNSNVQREAMATRIGLNDTLRNALSGAAVQEMSSNIEADRFGLSQQNQDRDLLAQIAQMAQSGMTSEQRASWASIMGIDLNQGTIGGNLKDDLDRLTSSPVLEGDDKYLRNRSGSENLLRALGYVDPTKYISWAIGNLGEDRLNLSDAKGLQDLLAGSAADAVTKDSWTVGDNKFNNINEAKAEVDRIFSGKQYYGKEITSVIKGRDILFRFNGKNYKTYNKALSAINKLNQAE